MVRGNWQKRVETAEARRNQARQRKQRAGASAAHKQQAGHFIRQLELKYDLACRWDLVFYTDEMPVDPGGTARERSSSLGNTADQGAKSGNDTKTRKRSGSESNNTPKKVHPRSKSGASHQQDQDGSNAGGTPDDLMCRSFFFTGKCEEVGKKSSKKTSCRWHHVDSLFAKDANDAANASPPVDDANGVEFVHRVYPSLRLESGATSGPGDQCSSFLANRQLKLSHVVYVVQNRVILFDRFRGGWLFATPDDYETHVHGRTTRSHRSASIGSATASTLSTELPGAILEHILLFLPDDAVGVASQICRSWRKEIGSPALWKQLLDRHGWPGVDRTHFVEHATVVRDIRQLQSGVSTLVHRHKNDRHKKPSSAPPFLQDFRSRQHAPTKCVALLEWSPGIVLAGFDDSTLRLFHAQGGSVRELMCQTIDPYCNTKRRTSQLLAVGIDKDLVGCLCSVTAPFADTECAYLLVVLRREDFLVGNGEGAAMNLERLTVIDVGQAILDDVLGGNPDDVVDLFVLSVMDFVARRSMGEVSVSASPSVSALGHGRFLIHATVTLPTDSEDDDTGVSQEDQTVQGRLVVISSHAEAVIWTAEETDGIPTDENVTLASNGSTFTSASIPFTSIVVGTLDDPVVHCCIDATPPLEHGWVRLGERRPMVVSSTTVVAADTFCKMHEVAPHEIKTCVAVYPLDPVGGMGVTHHIIEGDLTVQSLYCVGDNHVVLICTERRRESTETDDAEIVTETTITKAVVLYLPTGSEVFRAVLDCPAQIRMVPNMKDTVAMVVNYLGVIMAGESVVEGNAEPGDYANARISSSSKKKKKRQTNRGGKKDGFARGMTLRG